MLRPLLYYVTDRTQFPGDKTAQRQRLLEKIAEATQAGVDYIQLREKDLSSKELEKLAREALTIVREQRARDGQLGTALLVNARSDVALAVGASGVHLPSNDLSPEEVRRIASCCGAHSRMTISVSCHQPAEVHAAQDAGADLALFAPVFEKRGTTTRPAGIEILHEACQAEMPVLALGGVTLENAAACIKAGAAGIAAIRLFQESSISDIVSRLRL